MTITKTHLTDVIHKGIGIPKSRSFGLVGSLFEIMKATLILISGFGKFSVFGVNTKESILEMEEKNEEVYDVHDGVGYGFGVWE